MVVSRREEFAYRIRGKSHNYILLYYVFNSSVLNPSASTDPAIGTYKYRGRLQCILAYEQPYR